MDRVAVLDKLIEHFEKTRKFGYDHIQHSCAYRGDNDPSSPVRCAVGVLLPDELYTGDMEGVTVDGLCDQFDGVIDALDIFGTNHVHDLQWLVEIQNEHDKNAIWTDYEQKYMDKFLTYLKRLREDNVHPA